MQKKFRILVVDDELSIRISLGDLLRRDGYRVEAAESGESALEILKAQSFDLLMVDVKMPGIDGLEMLKRVKENDPDTTVVMMTAYGSVDSAVQAMKLGAIDYVVKPFDPLKIGTLVKQIFRNELMRREHKLLKHQIRVCGSYGPIIGQSSAMLKLFELVEDVASTDSVVLISGESGTGKEVLARTIHEKSPRSKGLFVGINFGAFTESLLESELFGYEKGAFTGATTSKRGLLEIASGGTFFLDEIGNASPKMQIDLLRVLQERKFRRVGGLRDEDVDFRVLAATNRDLEDAIKEGNFRQDLYYRLNVVQICIPPLRERRDDIPILAKHFMEVLRVHLNKKTSLISPEAMHYLVTYDWPGNVRELKNAIERALVVGKQKWIMPEDLPLMLQEPSGEPIDESLDSQERDYIVRKLKQYEWNISQTAQALKIDRGTLYAKIKKYGLS
ncbi:MAG: sigma-54-dependent Fis family transcriptional regulator [candidate division Zixibacteria bacterium]|nr:sigma-54-dependent Fis family transcriptional regulator [candidate division Zixibacteria bacterium]